MKSKDLRLDFKSMKKLFILFVGIYYLGLAIISAWNIFTPYPMKSIDTYIMIIAVYVITNKFIKNFRRPPSNDEALILTLGCFLFSVIYQLGLLQFMSFAKALPADIFVGPVVGFIIFSIFSDFIILFLFYRFASRWMYKRSRVD